nr:prostate and testis expressed protein 4 [Meriones unguiculatus]
MNPVTKLGTLLILTLSFLCSVEGLLCRECDRSHDLRCQTKQTICEAKPGHSCSTISYFRGSRHLYSKHLCMYNCKESQFYNNAELTYILCCEKNLCNSI